MIKPKTAVVHKPEYRSILLLATRLVARRRSQNYAEKIKRGPTPHPRPDAQAANLTGTTRHNPVLGIMQSIFSPAARRDTLREEGNLHRRDGELKMDWTKPPHDVRPMCFDCRLELW
jgi:hypothetical protein